MRCNLNIIFRTENEIIVADIYSSPVSSTVLTETEDVTGDTANNLYLSPATAPVLNKIEEVTGAGNKKLNLVLTIQNPSSIILLIKYFKQRRLSAEFSLRLSAFFVAKFEGSIKRYGQLQS